MSTTRVAPHGEKMIGRRSNSAFWESLGILPILVVIVALFALLNGPFLRPSNLLNIPAAGLDKYRAGCWNDDGYLDR